MSFGVERTGAAEIGPNFSFQLKPLEKAVPRIRLPQIGIDPIMREKIEQFCAGDGKTTTWLRAALAGVTLNFAVEHAPRLAADMITCGRDVYNHQSWRYVVVRIDIAKLVENIHPPSSLLGKIGNDYLELARAAIVAYNRMVEMGIPAEDARFAFPLGFDSNIVVGLQGPKIVDFLIDNLWSPYEDVQRIAAQVLLLLQQILPNTAQNLQRIAEKEHLAVQDWEEIAAIHQSVYGDGKVIEVHSLVQDPLQTAAVGARICIAKGAPSEFLPQFSRERQEKVIDTVTSRRHVSPIEHPHFLISYHGSEAFIQQLRRHRIPVQQAKPLWMTVRQALEKGREYPIIIPPTIMANPAARALLLEVWEKSVEIQVKGRKEGLPAPDLDYALISAVDVPAFLVSNPRDLLHILQQRLCPKAQWEISDWAKQLAVVLLREYPEFFEKDLGPACLTGKCPEKPPCGQPWTRANRDERLKDAI